MNDIQDRAEFLAETLEPEPSFIDLERGFSSTSKLWLHRRVIYFTEIDGPSEHRTITADLDANFMLAVIAAMERRGFTYELTDCDKKSEAQVDHRCEFCRSNGEDDFIWEWESDPNPIHAVIIAASDALGYKPKEGGG